MTNLEELLTHIKSDHVYIQTHNFPDPDAIASAFGLQQLLLIKGVYASICYKGKIDRYSTSRMIEILKINIKTIDDFPQMSEEDEIILVDSQTGNSNIIRSAGNEIICIDHHPTYEEVSYRYKDIRPEVGACSSIISEYYFKNHIEPDSRSATALLYGIKIDTAGLTRGVTNLDLDMFYHLYKKCDTSIIHALERSTLQLGDLRAYANAINSIKVYQHISFANTGNNCPEALIASISDFMLALAEVRISVVYSIKEDGIKISVRSKFAEYDAGKITNRALEDIGSGGGHPSMAGGFVPFTDTVKDADHMIEEMEDRFLHVLGQSKTSHVLGNV